MRTMPSNRAGLLVALLLSALTSCMHDVSQLAPGVSGRPNILFIMSDDHAAHALSAYGSRVNATPQLDRLAREGIRFDRVYATNSICTPSRATILTGMYSHKNGTPVFNRFDGSQPTVAKMLQAAGYYTAMVGKWHLGSDPTGFDYWNVLPGQGRYIDPVFYDRNGSEVYPGYVTDVITDLTIDVLKNRPKGKPFFLMSHHKAPHREWTPDEKNRKLFEGRQIPEPSTLWDDHSGRADALREQQQSVFNDLTRRDLKLKPPAGLAGQDLQKWLGVKPVEVEVEIDGLARMLRGDELKHFKYRRYMQDYLACVQSVDDNVGRLLDWLDANGLRENTVVVYTSDQGFFLGDHGLFDKRFMYEESVRMPFLVRWPAGIRPGAVTDALAINCDFAPTFLEIAGLPVPSGMQGRSLMPLLKGTRPSDWRTSFYYRYYHDPGDHNTRAHYGIRTGTHKLIYFWKKDQWECFDLIKDPEELHNVYNDPAARTTVESLKRELARLKDEVEDDDRFAEEQPEGSSYVQAPPKKKK
ncbi:MAG: arylsulfatase family protein [candidate division NC10 bacterium]|nr:arylsulfatase family protein [candidate division NC10 bacterium]